MEKNVR